MSGLRQFLFLVLSIGIHLLAGAVVLFLAKSSDQIYENIEITSYVTPVAKSSAVKPDLAKPKLEKNIPQTLTKEDSSDSKTSIDDVQQTIAAELSRESEITTQAVLLTKIKANRTEAARMADYSGVAQIELVVGADGQVKSVKLRNSLPYGLDEVALRLAQESKFKPAMINNKPVASAILFKVRFESEK